MEHLKIKTDYLLRTHWKKAVFSACIFCFYSGSLISSIAASGMTLFEFILYTFNNQYFLMFCFLPIYFVFLYSTFYKDNIHILVRHKKFVNFYLSEIIPVSIISLLYVLFHILCAMIIGIMWHLQITSNFSSVCQQEPVLELFTVNFSNSFISIVFSLLYTFIGLRFFAVIINTLFYFFGKKIVIFSTMISYILSIFAIQKNADENFPYVFFNNYFILPSALIKGDIEVFLIVVLISFILVVLLLKLRWRYRDL